MKKVSITLLLLIALYPVFIAAASAWTEQERLIIDKANWFFNTSPKDKPRSIVNTGLQERLENEGDKLLLLDVRNVRDFKDKRIKVRKGITMVNIPQKDLFADEKLKSMPKDKDIILICYTGGISSQMVPLLYMLGYRAIALSGGIEEWDVQGLPLEK